MLFVQLGRRVRDRNIVVFEQLGPETGPSWGVAVDGVEAFIRTLGGKGGPFFNVGIEGGRRLGFDIEPFLD